MTYEPALQALVDQYGSLHVQWERGKITAHAIGDVNDDGELDMIPIDAIQDMYDLINGVIDGQPGVRIVGVTIDRDAVTGTLQDSTSSRLVSL